MPWTAEEARYALNALISRRKIRPVEVERALRDRKKEIQRIRERLAELESLVALRGTGPRPPTQRAVKRPKPRRRRAKLSARLGSAPSSGSRASTWGT